MTWMAVFSVPFSVAFVLHFLSAAVGSKIEEKRPNLKLVSSARAKAINDMAFCILSNLILL